MTRFRVQLVARRTYGDMCATLKAHSPCGRESFYASLFFPWCFSGKRNLSRSTFVTYTLW